jgi:hypothetical protein
MHGYIPVDPVLRREQAAKAYLEEWSNLPEGSRERNAGPVVLRYGVGFVAGCVMCVNRDMMAAPVLPQLPT